MTTPERMAYRALSHVAERIGANNWARLPDKTRQRMIRQQNKQRFVDTSWCSRAHNDVVQAMSDVMNGTLSADDAMALLWRSDVWAERFNSTP